MRYVFGVLAHGVNGWLSGRLGFESARPRALFHPIHDIGIVYILSLIRCPARPSSPF